MTSVLDEQRLGTAPRRRPGSPPGWLGYAAVTVLGAVAAVAFLGRSSLYLDETVSATMARAPWHRFVSVVTHREANMVLYNLALRAWVSLGTGEAALRSLSVIADLGALVVLVWFTRSLFGRRAALVCGLLLAVDPLMVEFAQDARGYATSVLFVALSSAFFVRGVRGSGGRLTWVAFVVSATMAAYANFWAALVPLGQGVALVFAPPRTVPWRRVVVSGATLLVALVPLGLLVRSTDNAGTNWAAGTSAGRIFSKVRAVVPHAVIDVAALAVVVAVAVAAVHWRRRHDDVQLERQWPVVYLLCWLVVPIGVVVLVSFTIKPLLVLRYLVVCLPPVAVLVSVGATRLPARALGVVVGVLLVGSAAGLGYWYDHGQGEDWRGATAYLAQHGAPGDGVLVFAPYMRVPLEWYLDQDPAAEQRLRPVYPAVAWGADPLRFDTHYYVFNAPEIARAAAGYRRVWLVLSQSDLYPAQLSATLGGLRSDGLVASHTQTFPGIEVVGYVATPHP